MVIETLRKPFRRTHKPNVTQLTPAEIGSNLRISHEGQGLSQEKILASIKQASAQNSVKEYDVTVGYVSRNLQMYFESLD